MNKLIIQYTLIAIGISGYCFSATLHVPSEYPVIQAAIDSAVDGDTILVATSDPETLLIAFDPNGVQKWSFSLENK